MTVINFVFSQYFGTELVAENRLKYSTKLALKCDIFRFAVNVSKPTLIPLDKTIDTTNIGGQGKLGPSDIIHINKAYSCLGSRPTNAGGNSQVAEI